MIVMDFHDATILTPTFPSGKSFFYSSLDLEDYLLDDLHPGENTLDKFFGGSWESVPLLPFGRLGPVSAFNLLIEVTANDASAEGWTLHLIPFFAVDQRFPLTDGQVELDQRMIGFAESPNNWKVETRTQPASTDKTTTLMHARLSGDTSTVAAGGGTELTAAEPMLAVLAAPFLALHVVSTAATSLLMINALEVWGVIEG